MYNLLDYLEITAGRCPEKLAFAEPKKSLTYGQLREQAMAIGTAVSRLVQPRRAVVICLEKGVDAVAAFLGAMYAGCFYCYMDPKTPAARAEAIFAALKPGLIISAKGEGLQADCPNAVFSQLAETTADGFILQNIRSSMIDTDPAYCSFTSGSTGTPKGVLVSHRSVIDFIEVFTDLFHITQDDVMACQSPFDFDVSVKDLFSGLKTGASVVLVPKFYFVFLPNLLEYLDSNRVTTLIWAVSALCLLSERDALSYKRPEYLNKFIFSGEVMPAKHLLYWKGLYPQAKFINVYGPTEITCNCTYHILPDDYAGGEIAMGVPFPNERVLLLDGEGKQVTAPGALGEVCVAGTCVALGYCGLPEQTAAAFTANPLCQQWNERIYHTGDMARYGEDGLLYYAGRQDFQIKRHGRRVELGEVESALHALDGIQRTCVLYLKDTQKLIACYTGDEQERKALNKALGAALPDYMIPDDYVHYDSLPLNSHGKIDRTALTAELSARQEETK